MNEIPFIQLNMHRAVAASTILNNKVNLNPSICFLTEPCTAFNKVCHVPPNHSCVPSTTLSERPRTAIYIPRTIQFIHLEQLSNKDCTVVVLDTARGKLILASVYLDYNLDVVQPWLTSLMDYVDNRKLPLLMALDSNAHSVLYGVETNERGKPFEEFILQHNLMVENRGTSPTYHAFRHGDNIDSHIDVTLSKNMIPLCDWRVHDGSFNGSDHHTITWSLPLELKKRPLIRPWSKAKWQVFTKQISEYDFQLPENFTTRKVDKLLDRWYRVIGEALDKACPKREVKLSPAEIDWYGSDQRYLKNRAKRKYLAQKGAHCPKKRKDYVKAKLAYTKSCKKGRKESWRMFVEKTPSETNMAALFRIVQKRDKRSINTLLKPDMTLTEPGAETIQRLTETHFPAAQLGTTEYVHSNHHKIPTDELQDSHDWIDDDLVRQSMLQFKPNKAPGPDGLKPIVFKYLPQNAIEVITIIYKACISLCYTPNKWRETKVIFLPKPGKASYDIPKSYRPISLSNFLLKALERLVVWKMDKDMEDHPIHHLQHGFTKGKSTESAISNTADYIEQHLYDDQHCLGLFLDISSAFDSISIDHIRHTLLQHGGTPDMVEWYYSYLQRRYLEVELHGETVHLTTGTGFPQGGVCSARFWLVAFDEAIRIINQGNVVGNGYADDCSALIGGTHPDNMIDEMQGVLDRLVAWGRSCGLAFKPQKTVAVMFTRATRPFNRQVRMDGQLIPYSDSVVYLGVTLDKELKWKHHIKQKINKAKGLLMKLSSIASSYWGPKPKLMRWTWTGIVRPTLSYAAMAWAHVIEVEDTEEMLRKLNRFAMNTIVKVPRSTPTQAMEIILDIFPLHLHLKKEGLAAYLRLQEQMELSWTGVYSNLTYSVSHRRFWEYTILDSRINADQELDDCMTPAPERKFTLDCNSFVNMEECQTPAATNVYTDGSKKDDKVGAGIYIFQDDVTVAAESFRISDHATVYQAEMFAIYKAAEKLASLPNLTSIKFFVDSQAALRTFQSAFIKSKLALQTINMLNTVPHTSLTFVWTKAHVGTTGNEKADDLAKDGTKMTDVIDVPSPISGRKNLIDHHIRTLWQKE